MAITAVDSERRHVMLVAERRRLRTCDTSVRNIRRALEIHASPKRKGKRKDPHINRGASNYISAEMENLHRLGFFLQLNLPWYPSLEFKNLQYWFGKLAIIGGNAIWKMIFEI